MTDLLKQHIQSQHKAATWIIIPPHPPQISAIPPPLSWCGELMEGYSSMPAEWSPTAPNLKQLMYG